MLRSRDRVPRGGREAADDAVLFVLRTVSHALVARQGRADPPPNRHAKRSPRRGDPAGWWASSPIRTSGRLTSGPTRFISPESSSAPPRRQVLIAAQRTYLTHAPRSIGDNDGHSRDREDNTAQFGPAKPRTSVTGPDHRPSPPEFDQMEFLVGTPRSNCRRTNDIGSRGVVGSRLG